MFKKIKDNLRRLLHAMKIIKGKDNIEKATGVSISEEMYKLIELWKQLYTGYHPDFHEVKFKHMGVNKTRKRASLQLPKLVSQKMASLIFNEKCEVSISDATLNEFVAGVLEDNKFNSEFRRYLEYAFAMGGTALKVYLEGDEIKIAYNTADTFIPVAWDNKRVTEGIFISTFVKGDKYYTLLEYNVFENGVFVIKNELYESKAPTELGIKINLQSFYPALEDRVDFHEVEAPLFVYMKPNTANNFDTESPLGIALYANALDTIKALDIAFDSFQREFVLGKKRIIVPATAVTGVVDPETGNFVRYFDADDEVYQAMELGGGDSDKIVDTSVELRVEEHVGAINALLKILSTQMGLNAGAFTFDGTGIKTATEVVSEQSETFRTKQDHENNAEQAIRELVTAIYELGYTFDLVSKIEDFDVVVTFDDSIIEDKQAEVDRQILLLTNNLTTKVKALMKVHGITEEEAIRLAKEIDDEAKKNALIMPNMEQIFGQGPDMTKTNPDNTAPANTNNTENTGQGDE